MNFFCFFWSKIISNKKISTRISLSYHQSVMLLTNLLVIESIKLLEIVMCVVLQITKDWVQALLGFLLLSFANISRRTNHKHFPHGSCSSIMADIWIYIYIYTFVLITLKFIDLTSVKYMNTLYLRKRTCTTLFR